MEDTELAALIIVVILIAIDYITGLMKAAMQHDISSEKMRLGLWHKSGLILVMLLAEIVERGQAHLDLGYSMPLIVPAAVYISITEISSILENLGYSMPLIVPAAVYISITEISSILENLGEINPEIANSPLLQLFRSGKAPNDNDEDGKS